MAFGFRDTKRHEVGGCGGPGGLFLSHKLFSEGKKIVVFLLVIDPSSQA